MRKIIFFWLASFLVPLAALAAGAGFVPNSGIWFSRTTLAPGETVRVFTVVVNSEYYLLDSTISFFDNNKTIGQIEVIGLPKESAKQLGISWQPAEGEHSLSVKFIRAIAIDEKGNKTELAMADLNSQIGASLIVPGVMSTNSTPIATSSAGVLVGQAVAVAVKQEDNKLLIVPANGSSGSLPVGDFSSLEGTVSSVSDWFAKNREALAKAQATVQTITSTANKLGAAYAQTKSLIGKGQEYYDKGEASWQKVAPYFAKLAPAYNLVKAGWLKITNNNEPKRIFIVIGVIMAVWLLLKLGRLRGRQYYDK